MKRHALFVGVNAYDDPTIQNLNYPSEDAMELATVFKRQLKFDRVEKLINPAHSPEVVDAIKDLVHGLGPGDLFLFFFAGHGFRVKDSHVLVCAKDEYADLENEYAGLPVGQLKMRMRGPWNRMLVLDACQNDIRTSRGVDTGLTERDLSLIHMSSENKSGSGFQIVVTSCSEGQKALEVSDLGHGLFTSAFLDSVTSFANDRRRIDLEALRGDLGARMSGLIAKYRLSGKQDPLFTMPASAAGIVLLDGSAEQPSATTSSAVSETEVLQRKQAERKAREDVREKAEHKAHADAVRGKRRLRSIAAMLAIVGAVGLGVWRIAENGDASARKEEKPRAEVSDSKSTSKTFIVGFDAEFPPYGYKEGNEYKGFDLDLAREVCKRKGWKFIAKPIDWNQKNAELDSGSVDCIWNGFTMQGRENQYAWTPAYVDNSQIVLVAADSKIVRLSDLRGKILAVMTDTPVLALQGQDKDNAAAAVLGKTLKKIVVTATYSDAIMKLELGAADAAVLDIGIAKRIMAEKAGRFRMLTEIVMVETYGIGFKKGNDALAAEVWKTYKAMLADGTVDKLAAKYKIDGVIR